MINTTLLIFGLFALAFYWLYHNGKQAVHTENAAALNNAAAAATSTTNTIIKYLPAVPTGSARTPWDSKAGGIAANTQNTNQNFTILKPTKTPFIYEN